MSQRGCQPCEKSSCSLLEHELQRRQPRPGPRSPSSTSTYSASPKSIASHSIPLQGAYYQPLPSSSLPCPPTYTYPVGPEPVLLQNTPLSPPASTLEIIEWKPQGHRNWEGADGSEQSGEISNAIRDKTHAFTIQNFISRIPKPHDEDQWRQKRAELGLNDAQGILRALDDILSPRRHSGARTLATLQIPLNVPDHLTYRAVEAGKAGSDAQRAVALSMFGGLVFMGECCVALKMGVSTEHVEDSMRQFLTCLRSSNCTAGSRTFTMYRHVAVWVTQQMYLLFDDFHHRAFEMFLYAPTTISAYDVLARSGREGAFRSAILKLKPSEESLAPSAPEIQAALPFDLPFLVWANFRRRLGLDCYQQVCDVFGATCFPQSQFESWYESLEKQELQMCAPPIRTLVNAQSTKQRKTATSCNIRKRFPPDHLRRKRKRGHTHSQSTHILEHEIASVSPEDRHGPPRSSAGTGEELVSGQARTGRPDDGAGASPRSVTRCTDAASNARTNPPETEHLSASGAGERAMLALNDGVPPEAEALGLQQHGAVHLPQSSSVEEYPPALTDGVSPQALEGGSRTQTKPQDYVSTGPASERSSTRPELLLQAAAQLTDPIFGGMICRMHNQDASGEGEAFLRTGNPDAMLGVPEQSIGPDSIEEGGKRHCITDSTWGRGESRMNMVIGVEELYDN
ncbi:hypothetical protein Forpe1208_v015874 [Fusarium oxysporum f. sp. rapae]|uniref:Uncharacterized protein n=1 Tax=Fusarium oxysporum f. sp. rapae TaxID=485398 RepID=A0A8J5TN22_FUSOX|nr:hypothetical protein Forpe1208_v015874 [Fusarium oxysporum f. sp. rapae]